MKDTVKELFNSVKILFLGAGLILFTQAVKLIKNPESTPITGQTFVGLIVLVFFATVGLFITDLAKKSKINILKSFPALGWVSIVSLVFCLMSNFFVKAIGAVDFLSITTPVLAFAGVSVADSLGDLTKSSWKMLIVAIFVFLGSYLGRVLLAQLGIMISG
ncbi:MAG: hypothetical protein E6248_04990 [Clostridium sp.]|uniref:hypothetical protein n=1 Tax=Clostridium sp. TaxID=1506 RepID=UPI002908A8AB|nr:hypothetical protein [Clostridium sp.]MDU5109777.1 hypothetical protein [Clostridium sp.]